MDIKTNEIGDLLRSQIKNINENVDVNVIFDKLSNIKLNEATVGVDRLSSLISELSKTLNDDLIPVKNRLSVFDNGLDEVNKIIKQYKF